MFLFVRDGSIHAEEDTKVKSLKHLSDIYFQSVGYNSVLLLNIPPDRRGLIHEADVKRLKDFAAYRKRVFADNRVVKGRKEWNAVSGSEKIYSLKCGIGNQCGNASEDTLKDNGLNPLP